MHSRFQIAFGRAVASGLRVTFVLGILGSMDAAGAAAGGKFQWNLSHTSIPTTNFFGFTRWSPTINDPEMFGRTRLTLRPTVQTYANDTITWSVLGPYDFVARRFPSTAVVGNGYGFATLVTQGVYRVSMS